MTAYGAVLWGRAKEVLDENEVLRLRAIADGPPNFEELLSFDRALGGPGMHNVDRATTGGYDIEDRDVFRPFQYCRMYFSLPEESLRWATREIVLVHMCGLHLEKLIERVARGRRLTLGQGLRNPAVQKVLGPADSDRLGRFLEAYNASKHDFAIAISDALAMTTSAWRKGKWGTSTSSPSVTPSWDTRSAGGSRGRCTATPA